MHVYGWNYNKIIGIMILSMIIWAIFSRKIRNDKIWKAMNVIGTIVAFIIIIKYTVWGRRPSSVHQYMFAAEYSNEFFREMLMNTFLYFPMGLTLSCLIGPRSIVAGFFLSLAIETWQFFAGTGLAQGTDVICNTLGTGLGSLIWIVCRKRIGQDCS